MNTKVKGSVFSSVDNTGMVSLLDLGPRGSDITIPMLAALAAGNPILIPSGQWLIKRINLPANAVIIGQGQSSILKVKDITNQLAIAVGSNCELVNFVVDGNKANQIGNDFHTFDLSNATRSRLTNVHSKNAKGCGFYLANVNQVDLNQCTAEGYVDSGFKLASGTKVSLIAPKAYDSDNTSIGDGIALVSNGAALSDVTITNPMVFNVSGRGMSFIGNGARNVSNVSVVNPRVSNSFGYNIHLFNVEAISIIGGVNSNSGNDGLLVEGDVQYCRIAEHSSHNNIGFGIREITSGSTPNNNGFAHNISLGNGNNVITKVGVNSYVI